MSAAERKLRGLKNRKRSIITSFTAIKAFISGYQAERDKCEVPVRLENLIALWNEFSSVQTELETIEEEDDALELYLKERMELERIYYRAKGTLLLWNQPASQLAPTQPRENANQACVKLPDIKLPVFSGQFEEWLNFHDLFISLVHSSSNLSTIEKFYYLRSSLAGEALQLIQTIPISNEQYSVAWNLLESHFQNPRRLKRTYVQSLFDFPVMKRETAAELHSLIDKFQTNVKILKQLGEETEHWDVLLIHLLSTRLDSVTRRSWEEYSESNNATKFQQLTDFLQHRVNVLETVNGLTDAQFYARKSIVSRAASFDASDHNFRPCPACSNQHFLYQCSVFLEMTIDGREQLVRRHQLCRNCLRRGHGLSECLSESRCRKCSERHHTKLCSISDSVRNSSYATSSHQDQFSEFSQTSDAARPSSPPPAAYTGVTSCTSQQGSRSKVLLATATVVMVDDDGREHHVRALLDSGSECSFATERLAQRMKVHRQSTNVPIAGIGQASTEVRSKFWTCVKSRVSKYTKKIELFILPKVTVDLPSIPVNVTNWPLPTGIHLADNGFYQPAPIDVVFGADLFFDIFNVDGRIPLGESLPTLVNSAFGWVVSGRISSDQDVPSAVCNLAAVNWTTEGTSRGYRCPYVKSRIFRRRITH